jgi:hypothetical protein
MLERDCCNYFVAVAEASNTNLWRCCTTAGPKIDNHLSQLLSNSPHRHASHTPRASHQCQATRSNCHLQTAHTSTCCSLLTWLHPTHPTDQPRDQTTDATDVQQPLWRCGDVATQQLAAVAQRVFLTTAGLTGAGIKANLLCQFLCQFLQGVGLTV